MRPEELVRRAEEDVDVPGCDVGGHVRRGVDGVGPRESPCAVRQLDDPPHVCEGSHRVGRDREGDDAGTVGELPFEVGEIDVAVVGDVGEADDEAEVVCQLQPGCDVAVVVEARDDDLVARLPPARRGAGERKRQRGHVRAECHLLRRAAEEAAGGGACRVHDRDGPRTRLERPADVRVGLAQVRRDGVDHLVRHLRAARPVEQHEITLERAVAGANGLDVESDDAHAGQH